MEPRGSVCLGLGACFLRAARLSFFRSARSLIFFVFIKVGSVLRDLLFKNSFAFLIVPVPSRLVMPPQHYNGVLVLTLFPGRRISPRVSSRRTPESLPLPSRPHRRHRIRALSPCHTWGGERPRRASSVFVWAPADRRSARREFRRFVSRRGRQEIPPR